MRILCLLLLLVVGITQAQVMSLPALRAGEVSVSGLSSGAFMAVQFEVAFSRTVIGAGVIAGGPYFCAQGNVLTATTRCSCTSELNNCQVRSGGTRVPELIAITDWFAATRSIDPTSALAGHRIWMLSGSLDSVVPQAVMNDLFSYYRHYIGAGNISYQRKLAAQHAFPTNTYGRACSALGSPYINNCNYDAAGALLAWIYGPLAARSNAPAGRFVAFDQSEFIAAPSWHGMSDTGYLYIPPACEAGGCRLHVAFHGCQQSQDNIGMLFVRHAGYNAWADNNRLLILYPQTTATYANPNACWDWRAHDDTRYAQKTGRQMAAIKRMLDRLGGSPTVLLICRRGRCT
ncbi:PHB depolymerase family esterase [Duganella sp. sic0402]|uniref:extracellular catalytic domain type 2 short-chain-length polyhydroxyalkanoate depolymerase n=1 Tax=Duganella sp. sic0402 TaxID=2854786 RepID=UPI001E309E0A|nr:PHB depolymerase family esterase [Duganella sp. sic0402]